jgi:hypothetical protein
MRPAALLLLIALAGCSASGDYVGLCTGGGGPPGWPPEQRSPQSPWYAVFDIDRSWYLLDWTLEMNSAAYSEVFDLRWDGSSINGVPLAEGDQRYRITGSLEGDTLSIHLYGRLSLNYIVVVDCVATRQ